MVRWIAVLLLVFSNVLPLRAQPIPVTIEKTAAGFVLKRGGEPYFIKGAGGFDFPARLKQYGGNSTRTWGTDANTIDLLNEAHSLGISVMMGLWVQHEQHGFNYNDAVAVKRQLDDFRKWVEMYKDHPAVLAWGIGNEVELGLSNYNLNVWNAINDISKMIHEVDGKHPTLTVTAHIDPVKARHIMERAPDLDMLGVNSYGAIAGAFANIRNTTGWDKPVIITEWGPNGQWEVPTTSWGSPLEQTSTEKADVYKSRYETVILTNPDICVGSYVFLWSNKLEETPTWYGLFLPTGDETEVVDVMQYVWTGQWPSNRAPRITSGRIEGKTASQSIVITKDQGNTAEIVATDPDGDPLSYEFLILPATGYNGTTNTPPATFPYLPGLVTSANGNTIVFKAPENLRNYRLYIQVRDDHNNVATMNIPFRTQLAPLTSTDPSVIFTDADAYIRDGNFSNDRYGVIDAERLVTRRGDPGFNRETYLRFPLSSIGEGFDDVALELFGTAAEPSRVAVFTAGNFGWGESSLSWNSRFTGTLIPVDTIDVPVTEAKYHRWDVSDAVMQSLVSGFDRITLVVRNITSTPSTISWNSREQRSNPARLVISYNGQPLVTSVGEDPVQNLSVWPNPFSDKLFIRSDVPRMQIRIIDVFGKPVMNATGTGNAQVDLTGQPAGVYFLRVETPSGTINRKIIKGRQP